MPLRPAILSDIDGMFMVTHRTHLSTPYTEMVPKSHWREYYEAYRDTAANREKYRQRLTRYVTEPSRQAYVYTEDGIIAGFRLAVIKENAVYLRGVFVDPDYRGRGIGTELFCAPFKYLKAKHRVELKVLKDNHAAQNMYRKHGFECANETIEPFYGAKQILMRNNNS